MKFSDLTTHQALRVPCTICGAAIGIVCELATGIPRSGPHLDRKIAAIEAMEKQAIKKPIT